MVDFRRLMTRPRPTEAEREAVWDEWRRIHMKSTEFDESKFLNAKSAGKLNGTRITIYDTKAQMVNTTDDDGNKTEKRKLVIEFEDVEKTLVLNKTNREILEEAYGDETDNWRGKIVILDIVSVTFKGKRTPSIQLTPTPANRVQNDSNPLPDATAVLNEGNETIPPMHYIPDNDPDNTKSLAEEKKIPGKKRR